MLPPCKKADYTLPPGKPGVKNADFVESAVFHRDRAVFLAAQRGIWRVNVE